MQNASTIMKNSNVRLLMIFIPNSGSEVTIRGNKAQCIAHATEAAIPSASQFILFIRIIAGCKNILLQLCCKIKVNQFLDY